MKKFTVSLIIISIFLGNIIVFANADTYSGVKTSGYVNGEYHSFIKNDYFKDNYDELFEINYSVGTSADINVPLIEARGNRDDGYYVMVFLDESIKIESDSYIDFNSSVLNDLADYYKEIIYVGTTTPVAVLLIENSLECAQRLFECEQVISVNDAFAFEYSFVVTEELFDPFIVEPVKVSDARKVLRVASGLEKIETNAKAFYCCFDFNLDDRLNSADARLILRVAAGLDKEHSFSGGERRDWILTEGSGRGF